MEAASSCQNAPAEGHLNQGMRSLRLSGSRTRTGVYTDFIMQTLFIPSITTLGPAQGALGSISSCRIAESSRNARLADQSERENRYLRDFPFGNLARERRIIETPALNLGDLRLIPTSSFPHKKRPPYMTPGSFSSRNTAARYFHPSRGNSGAAIFRIVGPST